MLMSSVPGYNEVAHKDLTFHQLMNGMISKVTSETPKAKLDHESANKFSFMQFLVEMLFKYEHSMANAHIWVVRLVGGPTCGHPLTNYHRVPQPVTFKKGTKCASCVAKQPGPSNGGAGFGNNSN